MIMLILFFVVALFFIYLLFTGFITTIIVIKEFTAFALALFSFFVSMFIFGSFFISLVISVVLFIFMYSVLPKKDIIIDKNINSVNVTNSTADDLKKYKELYDTEAITLEEYNKLKEKTIG